MRKVKREDQASVKHLVAMESNLFKEHMGILEHLALLQYEDATPRVPGLLMVSTRGSAWYVTLKDPDSCMQLTVLGVTLDDALDALQVHLGSENPPWEPDTYAMSRRGTKSKK